MRFAICVIIAGCVLCGPCSGDALSDARKLLAGGNVVEAEVALAEAAKNPDLAPDAYYTWYCSLRDRGEKDRAAFKLETAAELARDRADWWLELGRFLASLGRAPEALPHFMRALAIDPDFAQAHCALAEALLSCGMVAEAEAQLREALRQDPSADDQRATLVDLLLGAKRTLEALDLAGVGLKERPDSFALNLALGRVYEAMGEGSKALEAYSQAAKTRRTAPEPHLAMSRVYQARGDVTAAVNSARKAAGLAPRDPRPAIALARIYSADPQRSALALQFVRRAVQLAPQDPEASSLHGWALHLCGRDSQAIEALTATANGTPPVPEAMYYLGAIHKERNEAQEARGWLERAVKEGAGTALGAQAARMLQGLGAPQPEAEAAAQPGAN